MLMANIVDSPITVADAQQAVNMRHTHTNSTVLNAIAENTQGNLTFRGAEVRGTELTSEQLANINAVPLIQDDLTEVKELTLDLMKPEDVIAGDYIIVTRGDGNEVIIEAKPIDDEKLAEVLDFMDNERMGNVFKSIFGGTT